MDSIISVWQSTTKHGSGPKRRINELGVQSRRNRLASPSTTRGSPRDQRWSKRSLSRRSPDTNMNGSEPRLAGSGSCCRPLDASYSASSSVSDIRTGDRWAVAVLSLCDSNHSRTTPASSLSSSRIPRYFSRSSTSTSSPGWSTNSTSAVQLLTTSSAVNLETGWRCCRLWLCLTVPVRTLKLSSIGSSESSPRLQRCRRARDLSGTGQGDSRSFSTVSEMYRSHMRQ
jgi:hypothetical protein